MKNLRDDHCPQAMEAVGLWAAAVPRRTVIPSLYDPRVEARYTYRLRVKPEQACLLQEVFDVTRFVWNHTLGRWSDLWRHERERLLHGDASAELTDLRHTFDWLARQPHVPQQQAIRALYRSISAFFDQQNPAGRPKFKR